MHLDRTMLSTKSLAENNAIKSKSTFTSRGSIVCFQPASAANISYSSPSTTTASLGLGLPPSRPGPWRSRIQCHQVHTCKHAGATNHYAFSGGSSQEHSILQDDGVRWLGSRDRPNGRRLLLLPLHSQRKHQLQFGLLPLQLRRDRRGQSSVVRGDSLFLMDNTNNHW
jgi:hypothetical protein